MTAQEQLEELSARWRESPVTFVRECFGAEPDAWQLEVLEALLTDPRIVMSACKGPGKSCLLAWCIWWFLACYPQSQVVCTSITADNLKDNLWKELALWYGRARGGYLRAVGFELRGERIVNREAPETWWCSARAFAREADATQQANTLAGLHADHVMVVLDELGDYPAGVVAAAEGIFATEGVNAHILAAGNPTKAQSPLVALLTTPGWRAVYITGDPDDPKRSPRIDIAWARQQIALYGRDNPWVMVNVLGLPPPAGEGQLLEIGHVVLAQARNPAARDFSGDARIWGVDPAYSLAAGADEAVLARRQGICAFRMHAWRGKDGPQLASLIGGLLLEAEGKHELPDALIIDRGGVGASCYDHLRLLGWGHLVIGIDFGERAEDHERFGDRRSEIWWRMAQWLKGPVAIPDDPVLREELVRPLFGFFARGTRTAFYLESKKDMQKRTGKPSPNRADALACTFAQAVVVPQHKRLELEKGTLPVAGAGGCVHDYNPFASDRS